MPWKEIDSMSLRVQFAQRAALERESMVDLCREFAISRKTMSTSFSGSLERPPSPISWKS
jgi:hypothetical protein